AAGIPEYALVDVSDPKPAVRQAHNGPDTIADRKVFRPGTIRIEDRNIALVPGAARCHDQPSSVRQLVDFRPGNGGKLQDVTLGRTIKTGKTEPRLWPDLRPLMY